MRKPTAYDVYTDKGLVQSGLLWLTPEEKVKFRLDAARNNRSILRHLQYIIREYLTHVGE